MDDARDKYRKPLRLVQNLIFKGLHGTFEILRNILADDGRLSTAA
jgi:hypothetical protein